MVNYGKELSLFCGKNGSPTKDIGQLVKLRVYIHIVYIHIICKQWLLL